MLYIQEMPMKVIVRPALVKHLGIGQFMRSGSGPGHGR